MSVLTMLPHQRFIEWLRKRSFAKPLLTCIPGDKNGLAETRYTVNAKPGRMRKVLIRMGLALNYDIAEVRDTTLAYRSCLHTLRIKDQSSSS